ncbi:tetratricopeptide repeat protein [Kitasatospora sp. NPDC058965]|uniref:AfsR/SARP family transcriptional regulator n=1 Tax=Kitasatospora sp. NPDC058965 TaxID=3346682 RepID=UPI0036C6B910
MGPLTVEGPDGAVPIGSPKSRLLLGTLLLRADQAVSATALIDALWGEGVPATARSSLQNHVARLRVLLGDPDGERLRTTATGYQIKLADGELDVHEVSRHSAAAGRAQDGEDWPTVLRHTADALARWRGRPLADLPASAELDAFRHVLESERRHLMEWHADAALRLGHHHDLLPELRRWCAEYPLAEELHRRLMTALLADGRRAEALDVFGRLRAGLLDELGVEPNAAVQQVFREALAEGPEDAGPARPAPPAADSADRRNAQLPAATRAFTGRAAEVAQLVRHAREAAEGAGDGWPVVCAIDGMAGVGKSALAVHAARLVREDFPDGQLFLDLRGHTAHTEPLGPADALESLLRSLGLPAHAIPADPDGRAARYRDRLAGTRTLIVLDNAAASAQIRPLLPASAGCLVLVTSRKRLTGMDDAHLLSLDALTAEESVTLLERVAGEDRAPAGDPATAELAALCGHVPLALRITAGQLRHRRGLRVADLAERMRDEHHRLGRLRDEGRSMSAAFATSYTGLPPEEQRLLRLLTVVPGADVDVRAAAALLGADPHPTEQLLESLLDHNLLAQHVAGRYRFHDLIRLYARDLRLSTDQETGAAGAAFDRLIGYYQEVAEGAAHHLRSWVRPNVFVRRESSHPATAGEESALAWTRAERENLLAAAHTCATTHPQASVAISLALAPLLHQEGPLSDAVVLLRQAAGTAGTVGDRLGRAETMTELGRLLMQSGDYADALAAYAEARPVFQELGERLGEANVTYEEGAVHVYTGGYAQAGVLLEEALDRYRELGSALGEANALLNLARVHRLTGDLDGGADTGEQALRLFTELGKHWGEGHVLCDLSRVQQLRGDLKGAVELGERALVAFQRARSPIGEGKARQALGRLHQDVGDLAAAAEQFEQSLRLYRELAHSQAEARCLWDLGRVRLAEGEPGRAAELHEQSVRMFTAAGNQNGRANALHDLGRARHALGEDDEAAELFARAGALFGSLGDPHGEAEVLNSTGVLLLDRDRAPDALAAHRRALDLARRVKSPLEEARALEGGARCLAALDEVAAARADLDSAWSLYRRIGSPQAAAVLELLTALEAAAG